MMTTMNGWLIQTERNGKFCAVRYGVWLSGFNTLDDIAEAIRTRPTLNGLLESINDKTKENFK